MFMSSSSNEVSLKVSYQIEFFHLSEKRQCHETHFKAKHAACLVWRRFSNLFETIQSLFWAVFGLVSLTDFELTGRGAN